MNQHSSQFNVHAFVAGVQALPFHVCVYVDTVAVAFAILNVEQSTICVLLTQFQFPSS